VDVQWLVIESDSNDDTRAKLEELKAEIQTFQFIALGELCERFPLRTQRIAYCRNRYLHEIEQNPDYKDIDYVIVADLDGVTELLTEYGVSSSFSRNDWDVVTANQRGPYYDIWALRHADWSPNDCWRQYKFLMEHRMNAEKALFGAIQSRMITIREDCDWIEVESAFGGFAIYRKEALDGVQYSGLTETGEEVCEHVALHQILRTRGKRIFINPKLINTYTEQTIGFLPSERIKRYIKRWHKTIANTLPSIKREHV
jgi:hypothetical protein